MRNAGVDESQAGIKIAGKSSNNFRYANDYHSNGRNKEELKSLLIRVERGE